EHINQGPTHLQKSLARELPIHVDRLGNIFRYVNHPEAMADAIHRLWTIFKAIFDQSWWIHLLGPLWWEGMITCKHVFVENIVTYLNSPDMFLIWHPEHQPKDMIISARVYHSLFMHN
ncbi:hypothetical protein MKX03_012641, partial [Papaver bracteatum]